MAALDRMENGLEPTGRGMSPTPPRAVVSGAALRVSMLHSVVAITLALQLSQAAAIPPIQTSCAGGPSADRISHRAVALGLIASRVWLEIHIQRARTDQQLKELRARSMELDHRVKNWDVLNSFSPQERSLMTRPVGTWSHAEMADHSWAMEQAGMLLWALGIQATLPPYDQPFTQTQALKPIMANQGGKELVKKPRLRPEQDLRTAREEAALFVWRIKLERSRRKPPPAPQDTKPPPEVLTALRQAVDARITTQTNGADLMAGLQTISELDRRRLGLVSTVADSRLSALNYLCPAR